VWRFFKAWAPPGHFYSPLVDPKNGHVQEAVLAYNRGELPESGDIAVDEDLVLCWLDRLTRHYGSPAFPERSEKGWRFYLDNPEFAFGDAIVYSCMIQELRPKRIVEVGSGFSSCVAMDVNDRVFEAGIEIAVIDPYPNRLLRLLPPHDSYRGAIRKLPVQAAPIEWFEALEENDILFIDSSHVVKTGSDVNDYMFRILPRLRAGVCVHIHDIPYPFEYPPEWIVKDNRSWNEAYLLRAFLQYNRSFQIVYWNHFVYRRFCAALESRMPLCLRNCGASIWLRKL
jgi:hypothetical protein